MPDKRKHRGKHPEDDICFAPSQWPKLRSAVVDYSLLLTRGYAEKSSLKLVGDRFDLTKRQRMAVMRSACSDLQLKNRLERLLPIQNLAQSDIAIDGYNLLITIEAAISGAVILKTREGCFKDLASIYGTYRSVAETRPAITLIGRYLKSLAVNETHWYLDSPVSNSGKLKLLILEIAQKNAWNWSVELLTSPDAQLIKTSAIVASSDSVILDNCRQWTNLAAQIIKSSLLNVKPLDLS